MASTLTSSLRKRVLRCDTGKLRSSLRKSFNPEQPRGQPDNAGQFGPGGNASKAPKHGEHAQRLADAGRKLKESMAAHREERKAVFNDLKQHAHAANDAANEHAGKLQASVDQVAWNSDNDGDAHGDLEDAISRYDESGTTHERMESLKDIDAEAKACLARVDDQVLEVQPSEEDKKKAAELREQRNSKTAEINKIYDAFTIAKEQMGEEAAIADFNNRYGQQLGSLKAEIREAEDKIADLEAGTEGVTEQDKAANKQHLAAIIADARAAREALREYIRHRREMAAIKRGEAKGIHGTIVKRLPPCRKSEFHEQDHPRADDGKFGVGGTAKPSKPAGDGGAAAKLEGTRAKVESAESAGKNESMSKTNPHLPDAARPDLSPEEVREVEQYLDEQTPYYEVNEDLRGGGRLFGDAKILQDAINKAGKFPEPVSASRGLQVDDTTELLEQLKSGEFTSKGFFSASTERSFEGNVQFKVKAHKGLDASFYGSNSGEILLPANTDFKVISLSVKAGRITAELEQIVYDE